MASENPRQKWVRAKWVFFCRRFCCCCGCYSINKQQTLTCAVCAPKCLCFYFIFLCWCLYCSRPNCRVCLAKHSCTPPQYCEVAIARFNWNITRCAHEVDTNKVRSTSWSLVCANKPRVRHIQTLTQSPQSPYTQRGFFLSRMCRPSYMWQQNDVYIIGASVTAYMCVFVYFVCLICDHHHSHSTDTSCVRCNNPMLFAPTNNARVSLSIAASASATSLMFCWCRFLKRITSPSVCECDARSQTAM